MGFRGIRDIPTIQKLEIQGIQGIQGIQMEFSVWSSYVEILSVSLRSPLSEVVSNSVSSTLIVEFT